MKKMFEQVKDNMQTSEIALLKDPLTDFNELNEKEIIEMSRRSTIKKMTAGDILMAEDETDHMVYVVLHGKLNLVQDLKAHAKPIAVFSQGDWIEGALLGSGGRIGSNCIIATEPVRIMAMDKQTIDSMNETTQLSIYKRLAHLYAARIHKIQENENRLFKKNRQLKSEILSHIAFTLSLESRHGHPAEMASFGLLHEIGQIVIQLLKNQNPRLAALADVLDQAQLGSLLLKAWNLPDVLWKSVEYQTYPEFSSPRGIPEELRYNVTLLYLSHLCYNLFQGKKEQELPTTFLDEYIELTNWKGLALEDIAMNRLLPSMMKKSQTYPLPLRQLIERQR